jgi:hypothetical protein
MRSNHHGSRLPIGKSGRERVEGRHTAHPLAEAERVQKRRRDRREETEGQQRGDGGIVWRGDGGTGKTGK